MIDQLILNILGNMHAISRSFTIRNARKPNYCPVLCNISWTSTASSALADLLLSSVLLVLFLWASFYWKNWWYGRNNVWLIDAKMFDFIYTLQCNKLTSTIACLWCTVAQEKIKQQFCRENRPGNDRKFEDDIRNISKFYVSLKDTSWSTCNVEISA